MARPIKQLPLEEICALYEQGWTTPMLAKRYGVNDVTIWSRLKGLGVKLRGQVVNLPEDEIRALYCEARLSTRQIGKRYGVSETAVAKELRRYGIELRPATNRNDLPRDELYDMYVNRRISMEDCGTHFGVSIMGIKNNLKRYGIPVRGLSESHMGKYSGTGFKKGQVAHNRKELPTERIAEMYQSGMSSAQIAEEFGVRSKVILEHLHSFGVQMHDSSYWMPRINARTRQNYLANKGTKAENVFEQILNKCGIDNYVREFRVPNENGRNSYRIDFAFSTIKLAIELDGGVHKRPENVMKDKRRDAHLKKLGWNVLRIENEWLFAHTDKLVRCLITWYIGAGEH